MGSAARRERIFIAAASLAVLGIGAGLLRTQRSPAGSLVLAGLMLLATGLYAWGDSKGWFDLAGEDLSESRRSSFPIWRRYRGLIVVASLFLFPAGYVSLTGGFLSPFFCLLYLPLLLLTIRFGVAQGLAASFVLAAAYLVVAAQQGSPMQAEWLEAVSLTFPLAALFGSVFSARLAAGFREIAARDAELRTLMDVSRMLETALDLDTTVSLIMMNAQRLVACDSCAVYLCGEDETLNLRGRLGPASDDLKENVAIGRLHFDSWRFGDDEVLSLNGAANALQMTSEAGQAVLATLRGTDRVLGLLYMGRADSRRHFTAEEQALLGRFAIHIGLPLQQACYRDNLEWMAFNDPMTGLANFRYFQRRLADELIRVKRYSRPISVLMLDIDHFKSFNDTRGHCAGDILLGEIGRLLKETVRQGDLAARYGGEEFVIICPETASADAASVAERIRVAVERSRFRLPGADGEGYTEVAISVSVGYASFPGDVSAGEEVVLAADQALYEAKRNGRNCTRRISAVKIPREDQARAGASSS
ncbi:MAG TPA: sensor domain-containing diguanylate cyclase [Capsulimonadaceae bacterium]|nr:sensor domain-containing diguanylate cyclase [Capsulimonadaceae bacterium]